MACLMIFYMETRFEIYLQNCLTPPISGGVRQLHNQTLESVTVLNIVSCVCIQKCNRHFGQNLYTQFYTTQKCKNLKYSFVTNVTIVTHLVNAHWGSPNLYHNFNAEQTKAVKAACKGETPSLNVRGVDEFEELQTCVEDRINAVNDFSDKLSLVYTCTLKDAWDMSEVPVTHISIVFGSKHMCHRHLIRHVPGTFKAQVETRL